MAKSLMAAGVDDKFPDGQYGGSSEEEDLVFRILMKMGDRVLQAVLETAATLCIVAEKTKTVAIRVGDAWTIHSLGADDVSICLGNESVMQHCRVLDTDAFDIVMDRDFLRANPQGKNLVSRTSLCSTLRLWQWPLLRIFVAVSTKRVRAALRSRDKLSARKIPVGPTRS